jgi:uncharacterized membrane protein YkvA (DUF1232 family)
MPTGEPQPRVNPMESRILERVAEPNGGWFQNQSEKWNRRLRSVVRQTRVMTLILKHPEIPWSAKCVAACALGYIVSPIQLIPSFIPVIGQLDDVAVLFVGAKLVRVIVPSAILAECEGRAESPIWRVRRPRQVQTECGGEATI